MGALAARSPTTIVARAGRRWIPMPAEEPLSLWLIALGDSAADDDDAEVDLSAEERRRAGRFVRARDGRRFARARRALRVLLAGELECAPDEVPIGVDARGKPRLEKGIKLDFSVSHSENLALIALSWDLEVGVDIEAVRESPDIDRIAARLFTAAERGSLASLQPARRRVAGFQCWTRKEAYAKGVGEGIAAPSFRLTDVGIAGHRQVGGWIVRDVEAPGDFVAALAVRPRRGTAGGKPAWVARR